MTQYRYTFIYRCAVSRCMLTRYDVANSEGVCPSCGAISVDSRWAATTKEVGQWVRPPALSFWQRLLRFFEADERIWVPKAQEVME